MEGIGPLPQTRLPEAAEIAGFVLTPAFAHTPIWRILQVKSMTAPHAGGVAL